MFSPTNCTRQSRGGGESVWILINQIICKLVLVPSNPFKVKFTTTCVEWMVEQTTSQILVRLASGWALLFWAWSCLRRLRTIEDYRWTLFGELVRNCAMQKHRPQHSPLEHFGCKVLQDEFSLEVCAGSARVTWCLQHLGLKSSFGVDHKRQKNLGLRT